MTWEYKVLRARQMVQRNAERHVAKDRAALEQWQAINRMLTVGQGQSGGGGRRPGVEPPVV